MRTGSPPFEPHVDGLIRIRRQRNGGCSRQRGRARCHGRRPSRSFCTWIAIGTVSTRAQTEPGDRLAHHAGNVPDAVPQAAHSITPSAAKPPSSLVRVPTKHLEGIVRPRSPSRRDTLGSLVDTAACRTAVITGVSRVLSWWGWLQLRSWWSRSPRARARSPPPRRGRQRRSKVQLRISRSRVSDSARSKIRRHINWCCSGGSTATTQRGFGMATGGRSPIRRSTRRADLGPQPRMTRSRAWSCCTADGSAREMLSTTPGHGTAGPGQSSTVVREVRRRERAPGWLGTTSSTRWSSSMAAGAQAGRRGSGMETTGCASPAATYRPVLLLAAWQSIP